MRMAGKRDQQQLVQARNRILITAFTCHTMKNNRGELLPHLTHEDECNLATAKGFEAFVQRHIQTVNKNIVCHDALTYDYSFNEPTDVQLNSVQL